MGGGGPHCDTPELETPPAGPSSAEAPPERSRHWRQSGFFSRSWELSTCPKRGRALPWRFGYFILFPFGDGVFVLIYLFWGDGMCIVFLLLLVVGCWLLVIGYWFLVLGSW